MDEGWICPKCGKVWAPWMPSCDCGMLSQFSSSPTVPVVPGTGDPLPDDHHTTCEKE